MVMSHPETLEEMNDVMTSIGHQWEARTPQNSTQQPAGNYLNRPDVSDSSLSEPIFSRNTPLVLNNHNPAAPVASHCSPPVPSHRGHHSRNNGPG